METWHRLVTEEQNNYCLDFTQEAHAKSCHHGVCSRGK